MIPLLGGILGVVTGGGKDMETTGGARLIMRVSSCPYRSNRRARGKCSPRDRRLFNVGRMDGSRMEMGSQASKGTAAPARPAPPDYSIVRDNTRHRHSLHVKSELIGWTRGCGDRPCPYDQNQENVFACKAAVFLCLHSVQPGFSSFRAW